MLRFGDVIIQTAAASTLAQLSANMDIVKQMFAYGAIKPLINGGDVTKTNEACMLSCLGCLVQVQLFLTQSLHNSVLTQY